MSRDADYAEDLRDMHAEEGDLLARMFSGAWLDSQDFPPLEYAVPGIIPEGFGLLVAPPKAGKSWLVCGVGLACAVGGLALGCIHVEKRAVLYLALEDGQRRLQSRSRRLMCDEPLPAGIHFITKATPAEVIRVIAEFLQRYGDEKPLVIVDTLGKARPPRPAGTDLYQWDYAVGTQLKNTIDAVPGATLLVVHHTRKSESSDFVDSVSGSAGIAGSADFVLVLTRKRHSNDALLSVTGRDIIEAEYALRVDDGLWTLDGSNLAEASEVSEKRRLSDTRSDRSIEILSFVNQCPNKVSPSEVSEKTGIDNDTAGRYLRRLANDGLIDRAGRGLYQRLSEVSEVSETPDTPSDNTLSDTSDTSDTNPREVTASPTGRGQLTAVVKEFIDVCMWCGQGDVDCVCKRRGGRD